MKNKSIIKAMAIGISASMAFQPLTVFAEDQGAEPVSGNIEDSAPAAAEAVTEDAGSIAGDVNGESGVKEAVAAVSEQKNDNVAPTTYDNIKKIENASKNLATEAGNITSDANTLAGDVNNVQQTDTTADTKIDELNAVKTNIETLTSQTADKMEEAVGKLEGIDDKISKASTIAEANKIYEDAQTVADEAGEAYNTAVENYNVLNGQYETALLAAESAREAYNTALTDTAADIAKAKADLDRAESAANTLYNQAQQALNEVNGTKALVDQIGNIQIKIAEGNVQTAQNDVVKAQDAFDKAEKAYNDAVSYYENLGKEIENTKKAIAENTGDIAALTLELAIKEADYVGAGENLKSANARKTAIEKELNTAKAELERAKNNKNLAVAAQNTFNTIASEMSEDISNLEDKSKKYYDNELASANSAAGSAKATMGEKKDIYYGLVSSEKDARDAVSSKEKEIADLSEDIADLSNEITDLTENVETALGNKNALEREASDFENTAATLAETRNDAQTSLENIEAAEEKIA